MTLRIAMWSGPRNISTAMMRSWENRSDCSVIDEPFYAAYLARTGIEHPCREEILRAQPTAYADVVRALTEGASPTALQYQKHMTHHIPEAMDMNWCATLRHCFLVRVPAQVIASYLQKMPEVNEDAIGIRRQAELFDEITAVTGRRPAVIDSGDVLRNPRTVLRALCAYLEVPFQEHAMLNWPTGPRYSDGVWARHWYQNVERSTGFGAYQPATPTLSGEPRALATRMQAFYDRLARYRIQP